MNEPQNGTRWQLRDMERRLSHLEEHGSRNVAILAEQVKGLREQIRNMDRELREDIQDCRKENEGLKGTLARGAWLVLSIPVALIGGILLFWIQNQ